ncbi:MAG: 30S ribosomal protein S12 methylthiotransferase RimO [Candidatus Ornithospirochaeta sp.]|nr:30S ribosomal protein S12 methylthiotransferase RimO [Sphaerochaetaceae bacterium]MDY5523426.1 30S ribosomal protein S12 methylthiotransferase RimO [Candidatus Ornithospirochaeta sp.]
MKKIYVESLGCAKNQVDSEVLLSYAGEEGYVRVENPEEADVVVVNTCGFIESAKTESINTFFSLKERCPNAKMVMAGCLAQRYGHEMELEEADAIFGNHDLSLFPSVLKDIENDRREVTIPDYPDPDRERDDRVELLSFPRSAYLKISEGCNHCCSYCAIPIIRGSLRSRPFEKVVAEAERLIREGIYEINVIAQDLGAYGLDLYGRSRFTELMETLAHIEGDFVLRMLYIHPDTFPMDLIDLVAREEKILPYFDIPVQHADERILKAMRRSGSGDKYASLFAAIREKNSDAVIRTTLMLGFPGEDRAAFETLIAFIRKAQPDWMGSFTYSREEDTPAYSMRNKKEHDKAHKEALKWQKELEEVQSEITAKRLQRFVGKEYWALVEEKIEGEDLAIGRIYSEAPDVDGLTVIMGRDMKSGDKVRVGIRSVRGVDLEGVKID